MRSIPLLASLLISCSLGAAAAAVAEPEASAAPGAAASASAGAVASASASASAAADTLRDSAAVASPVAVLAAFERAWLAGASDSVLACMSQRSIELALHRAGPPGGRFPPSQAAFLIKDLLHYGGTEQFRVVHFEWKGDAAPEAEIAWAHRISGYETRETLAVVLAFEDGAWRVVRVAAR